MQSNIIVDAWGHLINNTPLSSPTDLKTTSRHRSWEKWRLKCVLNSGQNYREYSSGWWK